ncbi:Ig-like domain-containing protein, partial [Vibrio parahaemolyticus]|uniref:Ig-like domain-containing protein n=1 Tax=Vibrio parahaemolyticus TaxID=670 RepID=UPI001E310F6F
TIIKVLGNDTFEGDDKVVSLDTNNGPANGTVSVNPDGSVTYTQTTTTTVQTASPTLSRQAGYRNPPR